MLSTEPIPGSMIVIHIMKSAANLGSVTDIKPDKYKTAGPDSISMNPIIASFLLLIAGFFFLLLLFALPIIIYVLTYSGKYYFNYI